MKVTKDSNEQLPEIDSKFIFHTVKNSVNLEDVISEG